MGHRGPRETDRQRLRETHLEREPKTGAPSRGQIRDWGGVVWAPGGHPQSWGVLGARQFSCMCCLAVFHIYTFGCSRSHLWYMNS